MDPAVRMRYRPGPAIAAIMQIRTCVRRRHPLVWWHGIHRRFALCPVRRSSDRTADGNRDLPRDDGIGFWNGLRRAHGGVREMVRRGEGVRILGAGLPDIFCHVSAREAVGLETLLDGATVSIRSISRSRTSIANLRTPSISAVLAPLFPYASSGVVSFALPVRFRAATVLAPGERCADSGDRLKRLQPFYVTSGQAKPIECGFESSDSPGRGAVGVGQGGCGSWAKASIRSAIF